MSPFVCLSIHAAHSSLPAPLSAGTKLGALEPDRDVLWGPSGAVDSPLSQTLVVYAASAGGEV